MKHKTVIVGAGPVGALAAIYAANRGHEVEVYELRDDLREPSTTPLNFTKSINLALSERGINAMKNANRSGLLDAVLEETIPMHGRMIHGKNGDGQIFEQSQLYDIHGRFQRAIDRAGLNKTLLDELDRMPNVKLFFNHKLTGADFKKNMAWFEQRGSQSKTDQTPEDERRAPEICISFDFLIGADGAHSATRFHMMKYARMFYQQEYIDTLWCEFQIPPLEGGQFKISPNHLHIWPGGTFMFIAIPSTDGSFTCTLFLPAARFAELEQVPASIVTFFRKNFPGVTPDLINPEQLQQQFESNPHLPLISLKCTPYHYKSSVVILGDAAHAMVPFYGQGMNAGLEDVRVLFELLDKHSTFSGTAEEDQERRASALEEYTDQRTPDAYAINNLALKNYQEMSSSVVSPTYKARKRIEEALSVWIPQLGWATQYARVSFGNMRYSEVEAAAQRQGKLLVRGILLSVLGIAWIASWGLWRVSKSADLRGPLSRALGGLVKTIRGRRG